MSLSSDSRSQSSPEGTASRAGYKARRHISPWFVGDGCSVQELAPNADVITSLSLFCSPTPEFIAYCGEHKIETYTGTGGEADLFSTPEQRRRTIEGHLEDCGRKGLDGIDLDFEHLDPIHRLSYSEFLREASQALHAAGKKLSICVGFYPPMYARPPAEFFYDPEVIGVTCDVVRVMCYDMYFAPGITSTDPGERDRADMHGLGPTSSAPWARDAMEFWLQYVPREKLIMGLPAYSNDYDVTPGGGGAQVDAPKPSAAQDSDAERVWLPYEQIHLYRYVDERGHSHLFFASDADSTGAHLETVDDLDIPGVGFWTYQSVTPRTWEAVRRWLERPTGSSAVAVGD